MKVVADSPLAYLDAIQPERKLVVSRLRDVILDSLPEGFQEQMSYGMLGYVVPHSIYPPGYHCDPKLPLPFINLASQKNFIAIYHSGIYADAGLMEWFVKEYPRHCKTKLDMGKSCIRLKKMDDIPYGLIGELCTKMSVQEWIDLYENAMKRK